MAKTVLLIQRARLRSLVRGLDLICCNEVKVPHAANKTWCSQINKYEKKEIDCEGGAERERERVYPSFWILY